MFVWVSSTLSDVAYPNPTAVRERVFPVLYLTIGSISIVGLSAGSEFNSAREAQRYSETSSSLSLLYEHTVSLKQVKGAWWRPSI